MRRYLLAAVAALCLLPFLSSNARACSTFSCGPLRDPAVQLVYTSPNAAHYDAEFRAIVTGGYLDALGIGTVTWQDPITLSLPPGTLSTASLQQVVAGFPRGALYLFMLGPDQSPEQHSGGLYAYHDESDSGRFGVVPAGRQEQIKMDGAHELVEALADAEIVDPCGYSWVQYAAMTLQTYQIDGRCQSGPFSRP